MVYSAIRHLGEGEWMLHGTIVGSHRKFHPPRYSTVKASHQGHDIDLVS